VRFLTLTGMKRTRFSAVSAASLASLMVLSGCSATSPDDGMVYAQGVDMRIVAPSSASALADVVAATLRTGTVMLAAGKANENVAVSPVSLAVALSMLAEGARGETLATLEDALGASGEARRDAFAALQRILAEYEGEPAAATGSKIPQRPIIHRANRVVVDDGFEVNPDYLFALADGFGAGIRYTDLGGSDAKRVLSEWIDHHTGGLIKESAIEPSADLRLVLQDVILLAARWQNIFEGNDTVPREFTLADGKRVETETMSQTGAAYAYAEVDGWRAVRLPYVEAMHADLLLPPAGVDPASASPALLTKVAAALDAASLQSMMLTVPTIDTGAQRLDLLASGVFEKLGIANLLCDGAPDLSGIALAPGDLCVDQAMQQAVLKVHEEGTVAAAVTELGVRETSMPIVELELFFDRPFLFTVMHSDTDWPLFMAAIRDPRH
jgi:serine protease inhibitor